MSLSSCKLIKSIFAHTISSRPILILPSYLRLYFPCTKFSSSPQTKVLCAISVCSIVFYVHVTVHRNTWPCIVTCDSASWHVTVHRDIWPPIVTNFFVIKPTRSTNFTNLFCRETLYVSDSSSVHHQEFIHCTLSNGICHTCL